MAHGLLYRCSGCDFDFLGGYHPMDYQIAAICTACMANYLFPTPPGRDPKIGDLLELHESKFEFVKRRGRRKHVPERQFVQNPTGQKVRVVQQLRIGWQYDNFDALKCTSCGAVGTVSLSLDLPNGSPCRRCGSGILKSECI